MNALELKREIYENYMDADGLVTVAHQKLCSAADMERGMGNGLLHTGLFYTILAECGALTQLDIDNFNEAIRRVTVVHNGRSVEGLVHRKTTKKQDQQKQDDYYAIISASYHGWTAFAKDTYQHGQRNNWHWDNLRPFGSPNVETYFDRFPGFVPYVRMGARDKLSVYETLPMIGSIIAVAFSDRGNSDSRIHRWCQCTVFRKEQPALGGITADLFRFITTKKFGSIPKSWEGYFGPTYVGSKPIPHPLTLIEDIR